MRSVVVVQARTGSSRFPGKVLAELEGVPLLAYMLRRLKPLEDDEIPLVVATSVESGDDEIEKLCIDMGVSCFRGSEVDVMSRFVEVARLHGAEVVVRLTGDCPLVWSGLVLHALNWHRPGEHQVTTVDSPDGLDCEVIDVVDLQIRPGGSREAQMEHVTIQKPKRHIPFPKLSIDHPQDLERVRGFLAG